MEHLAPIIGVVASALVAALVVAMWRGSRRQLESTLGPAHLRELREALVTLLDAAPRDRPGVVRTSAVDLVVTNHVAAKERTVHLSLSQNGSVLGGAVASRLGFFLIALLRSNNLRLDTLYTPSGVHHLVFVGDAAPLEVASFDDAFAYYQAECRPLIFAPRSPL